MDKKIECRTCQFTKDNYGDFLECMKLQKGLNHAFVDWYYWRGGCPENCPLLNGQEERA